jgi:hypothetical protein
LGVKNRTEPDLKTLGHGITPCKLSVLFGGEVAPPLRWELVLDEEAALMEALADQEEDEYPDDSAMEGSGDDYE